MLPNPQQAQQLLKVLAAQQMSAQQVSDLVQIQFLLQSWEMLLSIRSCMLLFSQDMLNLPTHVENLGPE